MTDLGLKTTFLTLKLFQAVTQPPFGVGLHLWTQCTSALHFVGAEKPMADFGQYNCVFDIKLHQAISQPCYGVYLIVKNSGGTLAS